MTLFSPQASVRKKFRAFSIAVVCIVLTLIVFSLTITWMLYRSSKLSLINDRQMQIELAIEIVTGGIEKFAADYSQWDTMALAVTNNDPASIADEFAYSFDGYRLASLVITNDQQDIVYVQTDSGTAISTQDIRPTTSFSRSDSSGVVEFKAIGAYPVVQIVRQPIYFENDLNTAVGTLSVAIVWDEQVLDTLGGLVQANATLARVEREKNALGRVLSNTLTYDFASPAVSHILQLDYIDHSVDVIWNSLLITQLIVLLSGVLLVIANMYFHQKWLLRPLDRMISLLHDQLPKNSVEVSANEFITLERLIHEYFLLVRQEHTQKIAYESLSQQLSKQLRLTSRLSKAVEAGHDGVIITKTNGKIIYVNPAWEVMNGYRKEEVLGKIPSILKSGKTPIDVYKKMWKALVDGKQFSSESFINKRKNGSEWICHLSVFPIEDDNTTTYYVGIQEDVTRRVEVERIKSEFISMASHQLRTPLSAMRWFTELLMSTKVGALTAQQKKVVRDLHSSTVRMISLVSALLDITRMESGRIIIEPVPTKIQHVVAAVIEELQIRIDLKNISISVQHFRELPVIPLDERMIHEVFMNLIGNAIKYCQKGGSIKICAEEKAHAIICSIQDDGIGIPENEQLHVFDKFFRGSNAQSLDSEGTGLGLYLVKAIIESSGGEIHFTSQLGKGSTFTFTLPKTGMKKKSGNVRMGS